MMRSSRYHPGKAETVAIQIAEPLQPLAPLQLAKQALVEGTQSLRIDLVEALTQTGVAGSLFDAIECLEVGRRGPGATILVEL